MEEEPSKVEPEKVVGFEGETNEVSYTKRDLLLYALGIGYVRDTLLLDERFGAKKGAEARTKTDRRCKPHE